MSIAKPISINIVETNNYSSDRIVKLETAIRVLTQVLNSAAFENRVKNFLTDGERTFFYRKNFLGNRYIDIPYSNEQVFDLISTADESPGNVASGSVDLYLTLVNGSNGNVIGYGNPGHKEIFTYSTMFDSMEIPELANHYLHEWCHKLGFSHSFHRNRRREFSVPYGVGAIAEELAETIIGQHDVILEGSGNEISTTLSHDNFAVNELNSGIESDLINFENFATRQWRVAESLKTLLKQVNAMAPARNKISDGTIGDAGHETRDSDHNPWVFDQTTNLGIVTALDITHSLGDCDCNILAESLREAKDHRIKYVIWNRRIFNCESINGKSPWTWRDYGGKNPHDHHIHISVRSEKEKYDSVTNWNIRIK